MKHYIITLFILLTLIGCVTPATNENKIEDKAHDSVFVNLRIEYLKRDSFEFIILSDQTFKVKVGEVDVFLNYESGVTTSYLIDTKIKEKELFISYESVLGIDNIDGFERIRGAREGWFEIGKRSFIDRFNDDTIRFYITPSYY